MDMSKGITMNQINDINEKRSSVTKPIISNMATKNCRVMHNNNNLQSLSYSIIQYGILCFNNTSNNPIEVKDEHFHMDNECLQIAKISSKIEPSGPNHIIVTIFTKLNIKNLTNIPSTESNEVVNFTGSVLCSKESLTNGKIYMSMTGVCEINNYDKYIQQIQQLKHQNNTLNCVIIELSRPNYCNVNMVIPTPLTKESYMIMYHEFINKCAAYKKSIFLMATANDHDTFHSIVKKSINTKIAHNAMIKKLSSTSSDDLTVPENSTSSSSSDIDPVTDLLHMSRSGINLVAVTSDKSTSDKSTSDKSFTTPINGSTPPKLVRTSTIRKRNLELNAMMDASKKTKK